MLKSMKVLLGTGSFVLMLATAVAATPIKLKVGDYGAGGAADPFTGLFSQMQVFANTTTTQFGDPLNGPVPVVGDTFTDVGNLNVTSFTGLSGSSQGLGVAGSTGTAYSLTGVWNDVTGYVESSTFVALPPVGPAGDIILQTTQYTGGTFQFYIDADVDQDFGATVFASDDTNFALDGNAELIATLQLMSGQGTNTFNAATGGFISGSSVFTAKFTWLKADFWYDSLGTDINDYFLTLGWEIQADIDQNTDNVAVIPGNLVPNNPGNILFQIGSDHDGSIDVNVIPEPSTFLLLGAGLCGLGVLARKRRRS